MLKGEMNMKRKMISILLAVIMISTVAYGAFSETQNVPNEIDLDAEVNSFGRQEEDYGKSDTIVIDVFDEATNNQGIQKGWFGKIVKDKFNIVLNIINPQSLGESIFEICSKEKRLGDIIIVDKKVFSELLLAGFVRNLNDKLPECKNIMKFKTQIDAYNIDLTGESELYFGIPSEMTDTAPDVLTDDVIQSYPMLRWDLYKEIGSPTLNNLDDMLDALDKIHKIHSENEYGESAYPLSLWSDWDGHDNMMGIANVVQLTTWYGEKIKQSAILKPDNTFTTIYDRSCAYYKITKWLNKAYQMGLVDPESGKQNWNHVMEKIKRGRIDLIWYSWAVGFWNSLDRLNNGTAFMFIPVKDQYYYADADSYYGSDRMFGIGSDVTGEKYERVMDFLDWYASPEGLVFQHVGVEGLNYTVGEDGKYISLNDNALMDNLSVPDEYVGDDGVTGYNDGNNAINQWIVSSKCMNPISGERYALKYWESYRNSTTTEMKKEWQKVFNAKNDVEYLKMNKQLLISPNVSFTPPSDDDEISIIRNKVSTILCEYTWKLIMTDSDESFEEIWDEMIDKMDRNGYNELYKNDCSVYMEEINRKVAVALE